MIEGMDKKKTEAPEASSDWVEVYEEPPHRSSGWSMEVGVLKKALRYVPDSYEVMLTNAEVDDCEIAALHIESMYPPDEEGPGLLVLGQGQVVSSEYGFHERMDEDHELGTSMGWNTRKSRWQSR